MSTLFVEHETILEYTEPLLREAVAGFWRRSVGAGMLIALATCAGMLDSLLIQGDRSWVVGFIAAVICRAAGEPHVGRNNGINMSDTARSRRIFLSFGADTACQIFSVSQNQNDGSIYFSSPNFGDMDWLIPKITPDDPPVLLSFKSGEQGKLSLHGSGVTHVRPHDSYGNNEFTIKGATLKDSVDGSLGLRHLATFFLSDPTHCPISPAGSRKTDYVISTETKEPYVLVFWAIPLIGPHSVKIHWAFNTDDLDRVPPKGGWGGFSLMQHGIVWFAYRTKHMNKWPLSTQACYQDGYIVPLLIGTGIGEFRLELRKPVISFEGTEFTISL